MRENQTELQCALCGDANPRRRTTS